MKSVELRTQRAKLVHDARKIYDKAETEKRSMSSEEHAEFDRLMTESDTREAEARTAEKLELAEKSLEDATGRRTTAGQPVEATPESRSNPRASEEYRAAFNTYLRGGFSAFRSRDAQILDAVGELPEVRSLQSDNPTTGGYLVAPQQFVQSLIKFVNNIVFMRQIATKIEVPNAASLGVPTLDADPADSDWTSELATGGEDSTMAFGKREFYPRPVAKRIKLSNKLLRMVPMVDGVVMERLGYKFGVTEEKAYMSGNGQNQPLGVFTASSNGIDTSRDVQTGTAGVIKADDIIALKYNEKQQYWGRTSTRFVLHRHTLQLIRQLKDANNQYLWQPAGLGNNFADGIDRLLETPILLSEYAPDPGVTNTGITSGLYPIVYGDFAFYWIATALNMTVQRLAELYAETNQTGFIGRMEIDGMPVLAEAFSRLKVQ